MPTHLPTDLPRATSDLLDLPDPTDLDALRAALRTQDPDGVLTPLGLARLVVDDAAASRVVPELRALLAGAPAGRVVLLTDATAILRAGRDLKSDVLVALGEAFGDDHVEHVVLHGHGPGPHPTLHADDAALDAATIAVTGADAVVSVGGGTITDIGKVATSRVGSTPLVVVQTAASVDGFTDNVSVVLSSGVKKTVPSRWPDVVLADLSTIADAPPQMAAAGYGELLSMFTAPADWYLASLVGLDGTFHRGPVDLLALVGRGLGEWSPGIGAARPESVAALTRALDVRGVATGVSGGTAVLSGVEHLVSHMLDMHHGAVGAPIGLHGAQVGVASVVAATAWQLLFDRLADGGAARALAVLPDGAGFGDLDGVHDRCVAAFGHLDDDGALARECEGRYRAKVERLVACRDRVEDLLRRWEDHAPVLRDLVRPAHELRDGLAEAGVPATFAALDPAVDDGLARWAVTHGHLMRERTTVVDLLDVLGWWTGAEVTSCLQALTAGGGPS